MVVASIMLRAPSHRQGTSANLGGPPPVLPSADAAERDLTKGEFRGLLALLVVIDDLMGDAPIDKPQVERDESPTSVTDISDADKLDPASLGSATFRRRPSGFGVLAKQLADACIDECSEAQHMVTAIAKCKEDAAKADPTTSRSPTFWTARGTHYLERYSMLVCFAAYALKEGPGGYACTFTTWMHRYWQLTRIISSLTLD